MQPTAKGTTVEAAECQTNHLTNKSQTTFQVNININKTFFISGQTIGTLEHRRFTQLSGPRIEPYMLGLRVH